MFNNIKITLKDWLFSGTGAGAVGLWFERLDWGFVTGAILLLFSILKHYYDIKEKQAESNRAEELHDLEVEKKKIEINNLKKE